MSDTKGYGRDVFRKVFDRASNLKNANHNDPFYHLSYVADNTNVDILLQRIHTLLGYEDTCKRYGLGFKELLELPFAVFNTVEEWIVAGVKKEMQKQQHLHDVISTTQASLDKQKGTR